MGDQSAMNLDPEAVVGEMTPRLSELDLMRIDNVVLRSAIARIQSRAVNDTHADYYTKHSSHRKRLQIPS